MDVREFEDLIDRIGEDLSRWPDAQRLAAQELLASSAEARVLHDEARMLRQALASPPVRAPAGLADRIVAAAGKLKATPVAAPADAEMTTVSDAAGPSRKVLPVLLLLALCLWPLLAMPTTAECEDPAAAAIYVTI
jgi:hypothetical protein